MRRIQVESGRGWWLAGLVLAGWTAAVAGPSAPADHELIVQPDDGRAALLDAIGSATGYIHLAIYEIDDPQITAALVAADQRGVRVRILYNYHSFARYGMTNQIAGIARNFHVGGVEVQPAPERFTVFHEKSLTVDDRLSIIMTYNIAATYFSGSRDFGVITRVPAEIAEINRFFEADWQGAASPIPPAPALVWSPDNSRAELLRFLDGARHNLYVYNMEAVDPGCLAALAAAAARGVKVRFISAKLDRLGPDENDPGRQSLNEADAEAAVGKFLFIHAKAMIADYGTPAARAFVGSENFSSNSLDFARELGVIMTEPAVVERLYQVFKKDWARILNGNVSDHYAFTHLAQKSYAAAAEMAGTTNPPAVKTPRPARTPTHRRAKAE